MGILTTVLSSHLRTPHLILRNIKWRMPRTISSSNAIERSNLFGCEFTSPSLHCGIRYRRGEPFEMLHRRSLVIANSRWIELVRFSFFA